MKIAFCITCKGRTQHLKETLPRNLEDNCFSNVVFVLLDYNSPDDLKEYIQANHQKDLDSGRLVVYSHPSVEKFHMAHAKNMAHRCGIREGADVLVNLDADNFTGPNFAQYIGERINLETFLWARMVPGVMPRGVNGRIVVTKGQFLNAGGYDEKFNTWSHDDKDFNIRLRRMGYRGEEIEHRFLNAMCHNDKMRFRDYPEVRDCQDYYNVVVEEYLHSSDVTVVNWGKVGTGVVYRNFSSEPAVIEPIPTRIFGVGMQKTATTSLSSALDILGFESAHWRSAHWAKRIWREMNSTGKSPTLEKHYAVSDIPIPMLFRKLDKAYPGSKFILTLRNEEKWIKSVENHWDPKINPFRSGWDSDPWSNRAHAILYGRTDFDRETFLTRYRKHNAEVLDYFKDRPQDLLVLDMDNGGSWGKLCPFLAAPVPNKEYPKRFQTRGWWRRWWPWVAALASSLTVIALHLWLG